MALYSERSERQFCERLEYDLLFKWFLDLNIIDHSFDHSVFAKNRSRLLEAEVSREFLLAIVEQARQQGLLSADHFSVDGTLLEAWASLQSFRPGMKTRQLATVQVTIFELTVADAIRRWTFAVSAAAMRPMCPPRTRRPVWRRKARGKQRACALKVMC